MGAGGAGGTCFITTGGASLTTTVCSFTTMGSFFSTGTGTAFSTTRVFVVQPVVSVSAKAIRNMNIKISRLMISPPCNVLSI